MSARNHPAAKAARRLIREAKDTARAATPQSSEWPRRPTRAVIRAHVYRPRMTAELTRVGLRDLKRHHRPKEEQTP